MNMLKVWMRKATAEEQEDLAKRSGTTRGMLYHYANSDNTSRRQKPNERRPSAERAAELERASHEMHRENPALPKLYRTDLAEACQHCEYAQKCLGKNAVRADFPFVTSM